MDLTELLLSLFLAAGVTPWAFFFPGCLCCGTPCGTTSGVCSSTPTNITCTFTGFSNNGCTACADYNATYIATRNTSLPHGFTECYWSMTENTKGCCTVPNVDGVSVFFDDSGGDVILTVQHFINSAAPGFTDNRTWSTNLGALPIACSGYGTVNVPFDTTFSSPRCTHDGSDVEAVF